MGKNGGGSEDDCECYARPDIGGAHLRQPYLTKTQFGSSSVEIKKEKHGSDGGPPAVLVVSRSAADPTRQHHRTAVTRPPTSSLDCNSTNKDRFGRESHPRARPSFATGLAGQSTTGEESASGDHGQQPAYVDDLR